MFAWMRRMFGTRTGAGHAAPRSDPPVYPHVSTPWAFSPPTPVKDASIDLVAGALLYQAFESPAVHHVAETTHDGGACSTIHHTP